LLHSSGWAAGEDDHGAVDDQRQPGDFVDVLFHTSDLAVSQVQLGQAQQAMFKDHRLQRQFLEVEFAFGAAIVLIDANCQVTPLCDEKLELQIGDQLLGVVKASVHLYKESTRLGVELILLLLGKLLEGLSGGGRWGELSI
jgi:hypothetical protein